MILKIRSEFKREGLREENLSIHLGLDEGLGDPGLEGNLVDMGR